MKIIFCNQQCKHADHLGRCTLELVVLKDGSCEQKKEEVKDSGRKS